MNAPAPARSAGIVAMPLPMAASWYWAARRRLVGRDMRLRWDLASGAMAALTSHPHPSIAARATDTLTSAIPPADSEV